MSLRIVPVNRDQATAAIRAWHRHHAPPLGYRYALGCADGARLAGVATAGRPVARHLDDGLTVEVTRVATDGTRHACSALYAACWRAARALGYWRAITYTHANESGASLRAAGWLHAATRAARAGWDMPGRRRDDSGYLPVDRLLWVVESGAVEALPAVWPEAAGAIEPDLFAGWSEMAAHRLTDRQQFQHDLVVAVATLRFRRQVRGRRWASRFVARRGLR